MLRMTPRLNRMLLTLLPSMLRSLPMRLPRLRWMSAAAWTLWVRRPL